ncbi:L,D-transpeptidase [Streptomyces sp. NBC_01304]|uniref:L,D-transpeptidase n=1 Tax=Streptomyces sp. NBC_01304 TaxID=2903818 RepID=UPI002E0FC30C|nr:L,D-transpeptidase [Streptomyces sp. NBC_01304]
MSDADDERDEFGSLLRGLAAEAETPPSLSGSQIRLRGEARGRRRRVATSAAVAVVLVAAAALGLPRFLETRGTSASPAASAPASPSQDPSPVRQGRAKVSLDLSRRQVVVERAGRKGRVIPVSVQSASPLERLTVVSKSAKLLLPGSAVGIVGDYDYWARWVVELVSDDGSRVFMYQWPSKSGRGLIGVQRGEDAEWLYEQLEVGDTVGVDR